MPSISVEIKVRAVNRVLGGDNSWDDLRTDASLLGESVGGVRMVWGGVSTGHM